MSKRIFHCSRCGNCCRWPGYVRVTESECDAIADLLGIEVLDFIERYCRLTEDRRGLSLIEQPDGSCIFLEENPPRCMIQAAKPRQCKTFPLEWNFPGWETKCAGTMIEVKE